MTQHREMSRAKLGAWVLAVAFVGFVALFLGDTGCRALEDRLRVYADFPTITGLRRGSPVRLAGVEVGYVANVDFVHVEYECNPLTEDVGRFGAGRTNDCEARLFCAAEGRCAELHPWSGRGYHPRCLGSEECGDGEICITGDFRGQSPHVEWGGPVSVCAAYSTAHWRARVHMDMRGDALTLLRMDSRAMVASSSVLGGQLVDISPGRGDPLGDERRIQVQPSIFEQIDQLRRRIDSFTEKAEISVIALSKFIQELQDPRTVEDLEGTLANLERITAQAARGKGVVGALLRDPGYRRDIGGLVSAVQRTTAGLEESVRRANRIVAAVDRSSPGLLEDASAGLQEMHELMAALEDPKNRALFAVLLRDPEGEVAAHLEGLLVNTHAFSAHVASILRDIDEGRGTVGQLVNDPVLQRQVGRLLHNLARHDLIRALTLFVLERRYGFEIQQARDPAGPPRR